MFGLFVENGPFSVTGIKKIYNFVFEEISFILFPLKEKLVLEERTTSWSLTHNLIYIDNPVGRWLPFILIKFILNYIDFH